jgi:hypothetical protein
MQRILWNLLLVVAVASAEVAEASCDASAGSCPSELREFGLGAPATVGLSSIQARASTDRAKTNERTPETPNCPYGSLVDIDFSFSQATITHNNLGGLGPDNGDEEIYFSNVATANGKPVDLRWTADGPYVVQTKNGDPPNKIIGDFAQLNVLQNTSAKVIWTFLQDGKPLKLKRFALTIWDFDQGPNNLNRETVIAGPASGSFIHAPNDLDVSRLGGGMYQVRSTMAGTGEDNPANKDDLTPLQKRRSVAFTYEDVSSISLTFQISAGWGGRNFLFTGASSMLCDFCDHEYAEDIRFDFATATINNLGGKGPTPGDEMILFEDVVTVGEDGIDLAVVATSSDYTPQQVTRNGLKGDFAQINLRQDSSVELTWALRRKNGEKMTLRGFVFTIWDIDQGPSGNVQESIVIGPVSGYHVNPSNDLDIERLNETFYKVSSKVHGTGANNPTSRFDITGTQGRLSISFTFEDTAEFRMRLGVTAGWGGRNFLFSGISKLICEPPCDASPASSIRFDQAELSVSNLGGQGPTTGEKMMLFSQVTTLDNDPVDLRIVSTSPYAANTASSTYNRMAGDFASINLVQNTSVDLVWTFYRSPYTATSQPLQMRTFAVSIWDFDQGKNGALQETAVVGPAKAYHRNVPDNITVVHVNESFYRVASRVHGGGENNPIDRKNLTAEMYSNAITFSFDGISSFTMRLEAGAGWGSRNFLFGGSSEQLCQNALVR